MHLWANTSLAIYQLSTDEQKLNNNVINENVVYVAIKAGCVSIYRSRVIRWQTRRQTRPSSFIVIRCHTGCDIMSLNGCVISLSSRFSFVTHPCPSALSHIYIWTSLLACRTVQTRHHSLLCKSHGCTKYYRLKYELQAFNSTQCHLSHAPNTELQAEHVTCMHTASSYSLKD